MGHVSLDANLGTDLFTFPLPLIPLVSFFQPDFTTRNLCIFVSNRRTFSSEM